ncbi:ABC transporter, putative [Ixodes scapularis]|uniref:ABC transporter, putative n=1 Tax=Ixodes scapularis TaxID=6945 RepID=B7PN18_IXOSC|nr:ABC transporter, putative [Ixodes scapularis]|eukprot:XP_002435166.1 ABC transporter, putative [Ixodes scapularis]
MDAHAVYLIGIGAYKVQSALVAALYRKVFLIDSRSRRQYTAGEIMNLMSVDVEEVSQFLLLSTQFWTVPLRIIMTLALLWQYLGPSCLATVAVMVLVSGATSFVAMLSDKYQASFVTPAHARVGAMVPRLCFLQVLKLSAWELPFMEKVKETRTKELSFLKRFALLDSVFGFLWGVAPHVAALASFATFLLVSPSNQLTPSIAFTSFSLFMLLRFPMGILPDVISRFIRFVVSLGRLSKFLNEAELDEHTVGSSPLPGDSVTLKQATFAWSKQDSPVLKDVELNVAKGSLVAVVGSVGSGKSSLLSAILGSLEKISGSVDVQGQLAYVPQQSWIQNATVKGNIIFTNAVDEERYEQVVDACALRPDIEMLPGGENTEIGEKVLFHVGCYAREKVDLERKNGALRSLFNRRLSIGALPSIFPGPLTEASVKILAKFIFQTRILVTHSVTFLPQVDWIVLLDKGVIKEQGTYSDLLAKKGSDFSAFLQKHVKGNSSSASLDSADEDGNENLKNLHVSCFVLHFLKRIYFEQLASIFSVRKDCHQSVLNPVGTLKFSTARARRFTYPTVAVPDSLHGFFIHAGTCCAAFAFSLSQVGWRVYYEYLRRIGWKFLLPSMLAMLICYGSEVGSFVWLSKWSTDQDPSRRNGYLTGFGLFLVSTSIFNFVLWIVFMLGCLRAAASFHEQLLRSVMRSPLSFFDTTPMGRIVISLPSFRHVHRLQSVTRSPVFTHFSETISGVTSIRAFGVGTQFLRTLESKASCVSPQVISLPSFRHVHRLQSVTRSPVFTHFSETISGVTSIRAFGVGTQFLRTLECRVDDNINCCYHSTGLDGCRMVFSNLLALVMTSGAVLLTVAGRDALNPGVVGLVLAYTLQVSDAASYTYKMFALLETSLVAVERVKEYLHLTEEAPWRNAEVQPPAEWPTRGDVTYADYSASYREDLEDVLRHINFTAHDGQKIGLVGRTGAGKSSFALALFRIIEPRNGSIVVDSVDITKIGLHDLRSKMTIIPQDPVLFAGTLRWNLDPFDEHSDESVWRALEQAHLKDFVGRQELGLNHEIVEGGDNLSAGQRQLVCLTRALLRQSRVLVLDEATSSVDLDTDHLVKETIRTEFRDTTIITIAHRLHTIMDCDRILVLSGGEIAEEGSPKELLQREDGLFRAMAKDAGLA